MKKLFTGLSLIAFALAGNNMNIGVQSRILDNRLTAYDLSCSGASGNIKYYVTGLPNGVNFSGNTITVTNSASLGEHPIRIRAVDEVGQQVQRVVTLRIASSGAWSNSNNFAGSTGSTGSVNSSSSSSSSSSTTISTSGSSGSVSGSTSGVTTGASGGVSPSGPSGASGPAGSTGSTGVSAGTRLNTIISTFSSQTTTTRPSYPSNRFPDSNLPTGADPNLPNTQTLFISSSQTQPTPTNRRPINADDVALSAASNRHQNATKGITNLLKIIDQARANRDQAQSDIQVYTQAYNDAVAGQRNAQNDVISAETRVTQITSAITQLTSTIDDLRNRINQTTTQNDAWQRQRTTIVSTITSNQAARATLLDNLKNLDAQTAQYVKQLSDQNSQCSSINDAINAKTRDLTNAQNQLASTQQTRRTIVTEITTRTNTVDDLRRRLQQAEQELADAKIRLSNLESRIQTLPGVISTLRSELETLRARAKACADQVARIQAIIDNLKGDKYPGITRDINALDAKISASRTRVTEIDNTLASTQGPLADLRNKLQQAQDDLVFIRTQRTTSQETLRAAYQSGNDSNNRVAFARQNLDAVIKRFQDESRIVSDATLNLESARAEQALARKSLEELMYHIADVLPEAIVPNGNLSTNPGTPYGNNPSGSPLGPVRRGGNGAAGSFVVNNWRNYLSSAYGAGVNPSFPDTVTELFPFSFLSSVSGNMSSGTTVVNGDVRGYYAGERGTCGGRGPSNNLGQVVATGVVVNVGSDSFDVRGNDGRVYQIGVAPCTQLNANKASYSVQSGDQAVVRGWALGGNVVKADQVTCLTPK